MRSPWFPAAGRPRGHGERLPGAPWCGVGRSALALSGDDGGGGAEAWLVKCFNKEVANHNEAPRNFHGLLKFTAYDSEVILANARLEMVIGHDRPWLKGRPMNQPVCSKKMRYTSRLKKPGTNWTTRPARNGMPPDQKKKAYRCDVTYVTNSYSTAERKFWLLWGNHTWSLEHHLWIGFFSGFFMEILVWFKPGCHTGCQNKALQSPSVSSDNMVNSRKDRSQRPKRYL